MISPRSHHNFQVIKLGLISITAGLAGLALCNYVSTTPSLTTTPTEPYAASIPWLLDQATCENTDRSWHDEQCWDSQHDPNF